MTRSFPLAPSRSTLLFLLGLSSLGPLLLLFVVSVSGEWFYPALLPPRLHGASWAALLRGEGRLAGAATMSLGLAGGTGMLASGLALPIGRALAELRGWRRHLGAAAALLPVAAPPVSLAVGLQFSFLYLGLGGTVVGVLLAHLVPAVGYTSLFFLGVFSAYDTGVEDVARSLGASRWQTLRRVTLPLLRRPLLEAFVLGFLVSWAQLPLTLLVGQGVVTTLPVEVLAYVRAGQDALAAAGALLLVLPALLVLAAAGLAIRTAEAVVV